MWSLCLQKQGCDWYKLVKIYIIPPLAIVVCISHKKEVAEPCRWIAFRWLQFVWLAVAKVTPNEYSHLHSSTEVVLMLFDLIFCAILLSLGSKPRCVCMCTHHCTVQSNTVLLIKLQQCASHFLIACQLYYYTYWLSLQVTMEFSFCNHMLSLAGYTFTDLPNVQ